MRAGKPGSAENIRPAPMSGGPGNKSTASFDLARTHNLPMTVNSARVPGAADDWTLSALGTPAVRRLGPAERLAETVKEQQQAPACPKPGELAVAFPGRVRIKLSRAKFLLCHAD